VPGRRTQLAVVLCLALDGGARAQAPEKAPEATAISPQRVEVPIKQVTLPDGEPRYAVRIRVGRTEIEAGLDTGSTGLRILPGTLAPGDAVSTAERESTRYGSGAQLDGVVAKAAVDIGGLKGDARFELVDKVGCARQMTNCPAARVAQADYGIMGDGLAGAGFKAILGVGLKTVRIDNPLRTVGANRFIVDLPRDETETGRLILNPAAADLDGFRKVPAYPLSAEQTQLHADTVTGCLVPKAGGAKICGALTFDTGAPGIRVVSPDPLGVAWPPGTEASIVLDDGAGGVAATQDVAIGSRTQSANLTFKEMPNLPKTVIRAGTAPYLVYSVFYDLDQGGLAVRARAPRS
jgi:hypothetical protein